MLLTCPLTLPRHGHHGLQQPSCDSVGEIGSVPGAVVALEEECAPRPLAERTSMVGVVHVVRYVYAYMLCAWKAARACTCAHVLCYFPDEYAHVILCVLLYGLRSQAASIFTTSTQVLLHVSSGRTFYLYLCDWRPPAVCPLCRPPPRIRAIGSGRRWLSHHRATGTRKIALNHQTCSGGASGPRTAGPPATLSSGLRELSV